MKARDRDLQEALRYAIHTQNPSPMSFYSGVLYGQATRASGPSMFCFGMAAASFIGALNIGLWGSAIVLLLVVLSWRIVRAADRLLFLSVRSYREDIR